jgi:hypothetical protein
MFNASCLYPVYPCDLIGKSSPVNPCNGCEPMGYTFRLRSPCVG